MINPVYKQIFKDMLLEIIEHEDVQDIIEQYFYKELEKRDVEIVRLKKELVVVRL